MEQFFETYTASGGLHTWITTTSFLSIAVALLLFFGVARFYQKMSISFFFPLFCIIALLCATFEIGSKVTIGSFSLKRLLLLITGISLLWFLFHINYSLFKRNWDGAFFIANLGLDILLGYLVYRYNTVLAVLSTLQSPIFRNFGILQIVPAWLKNINFKQSAIVIVACCIVVACSVIRTLLYWHICKNFTWKYAKDERIQKILQILLFLTFIVKPEIAICILDFLPFAYGRL